MSEYIPKYPSKEGDDSNKTSSELLAETLKPIYVPQDLMLAWESHLASYSRDTNVLLDQVKDSELALNTQYQALLARVQKYEQMLQDITMDSNEFTMDTDEVNFTGWNILAQASYWDYLLRKEITKLSDQIKSTEYKGGLVTEVTDAVLEGLIADNTYISNVIGALSDTPLIRELDEALTSTVTSITDLQAESVRLAEKQAADAAAFADQQEEMLGQLVTSIEASKAEQLNRLAEEAAIRTQLLQELEAKTDAITADYNAVVDTLHTTVIQELTTMQDGVSASVSELKTADEAIITSLDAYKVSNGQNIAALQNSVNVVTNTQESIATQVTGLIASFDQIDLGLSKAQADIITSNQARADGDAALSQQITTINTGLGDANSRIDTVNTAVSTLDAATATKFSELATTLAGVDDSIASVRQIADTAVSNDTAQATEINALKSRMTVTEGDVINKADASALSSLDTRVGSVEGKYTSQASDITKLSNSLDTTNVNVGTAQTAAQNAMNAAGAKGKVIFGNTVPLATDRLVQNLWIDTTGNANTPKRWDGSAWVVVTDKVATDAAKAVSDLDATVKTKADVTALNSLTTKVTDEAEKTTANTNSITTLNSDIVKINNDLATKASASALNSLTTRVATEEDKSTSQGNQITKLTNDLATTNNKVNTKADATAVQTLDNKVTQQGTDISSQGASITKLTNDLATTNQALETKASVTALSALDTKVTKQGTDITSQGSSITKLQSDLTQTNTNVSNKADSSALTALDNKVTAVDGRVTATNSNVAALTGRVSTVEGEVTKKADASALTSLSTRVDTEEGKSLSQGNAITTLENTVNHATTGLNSKASSSALTSLDNKVTLVDDKVSVTNSSLLSLEGRVTTAENGIASKLDASVINGYYTKTESDQATASSITSLRAQLAAGARNFVRGTKEPAQGHWWMYQRPLTAKLTGIFTISFDVEALDDTPISGSGAGVGFNRGNGGEGGFNYVWYPNLAMKGHLTHTLTLDSGDFTHFGIYANNYVKITNVMVQHGDIDYPWAAAPEDNEAAIEANAQAIHNTESTVATVDGKVNAQATDLLNLSTGLTNLNNTKLDASIIQQYRTAVDQDIVTSGAITQFSSKLKVGGENLLSGTALLDRPTKYKGFGVHEETLNAGIDSVGRFSYLLSTLNEEEYVLSFDAKSDREGALLTSYFYGPNTTFYLETSEGVVGNNSDGCANTRLSTEWKRYWVKWKHTPTSGNKHFIGARLYPEGITTTYYIARMQLEVGSIPSEYSDRPIDVLNKLSANATAIENTNTQVSNVANNLAAESAKVTNLSASLANLSLGGFNLLYNGDFSTNSYSGWNFVAHITQADTIAVLNRNGGWLSDLALNADPSRTLVINTQGTYPVDGRQYIDAYQKIAVSGDSFYQLSAYVAPHRSKAVIYASFFNHLNKLIGYSTIGVEPNSVCSQPDAGALGGKLLQNYRRIYVNTKTPSDAAYLHFNIRFVSFDSAYLFMTRTMCCQVSSLNSPLIPWNEGSSAAANVASTSLAKVTEVDGKVTTLSQQTATLETTVGDNTSTLVVQGNSIDGIKAEYFVKTDVNGLVAGYGLVNSGTASAFGVNADYFYVGKQSDNKKPFLVLTSAQTIDGITYPAGTWINTAIIANATIGSAHIADAAITNAKIKDATIESAKIKSIKADKLEIGNPLVGPITASMVTGTSLTNAANLFNEDAAANGSYATYGTGTQSDISGVETNYIQVDVGATVSMPEVRFFFRGSTGRKTYIKLKASVDGVIWDYIMGSTSKWETIDDMPPSSGNDYSTVICQASFSWYGVKPYRYLRIYGNGSSASTTNELVAIIGNASGTVTKIGSEGILTGAITADKIQVDSLSAVSANLGTIEVGTANIASAAITAAKIADAAITTAKIGDLQVDTLKIKDNAVTIGVAASNASSLAITSYGGKIRVEVVVDCFYQVTYTGNVMYRVLRNGVEIKAVAYPSNGSFGGTGFDNPITTHTWGYVGSIILSIDQPAAGTHTYSVQRAVPYGGYASVNVVGITLTEFKK